MAEQQENAYRLARCGIKALEEGLLIQAWDFDTFKEISEKHVLVENIWEFGFLLDELIPGIEDSIRKALEDKLNTLGYSIDSDIAPPREKLPDGSVIQVSPLGPLEMQIFDETQGWFDIKDNPNLDGISIKVLLSESGKKWMLCDIIGRVIEEKDRDWAQSSYRAFNQWEFFCRENPSLLESHINLYPDTPKPAINKKSDS